MADIATLYRDARHYFQNGYTRSLKNRKKALNNLLRMLEEKEEDFVRALQKDLGKNHFESYTSEIGFIKAECRHTLRHFEQWCTTQQFVAPLTHQPATCKIYQEALGVVLIIGPWNFPLQLVLAPLISALAAGNCAILKTSELAPALSATLAKIIPHYFDKGLVSLVEGGPHLATQLLERRFDHVFFTGSTRVGQIIMQKAAENLTPVTLELGGKSPCIIDETANIPLSAKRIAWGKFMNAGQVCIAPDYILVQKQVKAAFIEHLKKAIIVLYGQDPQKSPDYGRIINDAHFKRLCLLLEGQTILLGGVHDEKTRYFSPTLIDEPELHHNCMLEEIFGPILPILSFDTLQESIRFVNEREKPLALYFFSQNATAQEKILEQTSSGGVCINDTVSHVAVASLPFGGIGNSGIGAYRGKQGFHTFSHSKSVLVKSTLVDVPLRYPPFSKTKLRIAKWFL